MARWYIDSWSVLDGTAFASLRDPRDWTKETLSPAETTVVIGPPDWRAVSIARLSTAVSAARGTFQEGVLGENGQEIEFDDLEQIRETVRRSYLAGGLGLETPGRAEPIRPELARTVSDDEWRRMKSLLATRDPHQRNEFEHQLVKVLSYAGRKTLPPLAELLTRSTDRGWWAGAETSERRADLAAWTATAWLLQTTQPRRPHDRSFPYAFAGWPAVVTLPLPHRLRLLFRLPAAGAYPGFPTPRTLGDQLLLACASRQCWDALDSFDAFLPLVLCAFVVAAPTPEGMLTDDIFQSELTQEAMRWLTAVIAPPPLTKRVDSMLEQLVLDIAKLRLGGHTHTGGTRLASV